MIKEAIILAGGLGTRLRSVVADLPKCMAPVAGRPFLFYVINYLRSQGVEKFIFSLGYKHEAIEAYLQDQFSTLDYKVVIEEEPLGTGGAARLACLQSSAENVLLANGDTMFKIGNAALSAFHTKNESDCTLTLKPLRDFDRYGVVEIDATNAIKSFQEKKYYEEGLINGGLYAINRHSFLSEDFPEKFSFEKDYLEAMYDKRKMFGLIQDSYFIDIGIPDDFNRAQVEFASAPLDLKNVDKSWTLFLDRDGVINHDKDNSYIFSADEFIFYDGNIEAFQKLSEKFGKIIIVTNQRGVGKALMTEDDLTAVHTKMQHTLAESGVHIDGIYYATSLSNMHPDRKPNPGMAVLAKRDFTDIDLSKSIMVGNNLSDMGFGRHAGTYTVFVKTTKPAQEFPHPDIDMIFDSLAEFAKAL